MIRRSISFGAVAAVVAALLVLLPGSPAQAAGATVTGIDGVRHDACRYHPFRYSVDPAKSDDWSLEVRAINPRGEESASAYLWDDGSTPLRGKATGSDGLFICGFEPAGRWRLQTTLGYWDGWDYVEESAGSSTFRLRKPLTRTRLRVNDRSARQGQRLRFTVRSRAEFPAGFFADKYAKVKLQRKTRSGWKTMRRDFANHKGVARFKVRWKDRKKVRVRAVTVSTDVYRGSTSKRIRIR